MESGSAFRYLSSVFADDFALTSSMKLQKVYMVLAHIQLLTQNINFLWNPSIKIAFWSSFIDFWTILNYPCVDSLFASTGEIFTFLILVTSLLTLSVLLILIHLITTFFRKSTPKFILKLLRFIIALICELYFIPSAIVILLLFKYSYVNTDHLEEYTNFPSSKKFNYGTFGMVLSILLLGVLLVITFIREACCFVVRHSMAELHLEAKSSPNADILMKLFSFINCVMFISRQLEGYEIYLVFAAMQYLYCIYKYLYYLPYYSPFVNFVKVLVYFEAFCISLFFLFAFVADNATIAFVLAICMQPVIVLLVKNAIEYRMSKVSKFTQEIKSNLVTFELSARESLNSEENPQILINAMNENFDHNQNKLVYVYLANYCHDKLANPALASVKISLTNYSGFDLIGNFQIYKLQKKFEDCKINNSKALQLCIYLLDSAFNFKLDKRLCKKIKKLCDLILEKNVPLKKLKTAIFYVGQKIEKTVKCYEENIAKYPESRLLQKMLGTLLSDILNTPNIGKTYLDMYESRSSIPKTKKTYSVEDSLILITSGDQKDFGKVLYASKSFCDLLKLKFDNVKDYNLADFIPKVYSETHEKYLYSFIRGSMSTIVSMIFPVFLVDSQGFLIECYIRSECVGCNSQVKFISEITPNQTSLREIAIINAAGYIYCHSQLFPNKIGEDSYKIEGRYLAEILPENCLREFNQEISYTTEFYSFNKKAFISLGYSISSIFQKSANIFVFYLVDDQRQVAKMQRKRNFKVHFQKIRLSFSDQLDRIEANQPKEEDEIEENVKKWEKNQEENKENVLKKLSLDQNMTRILSECNQDENCEKSHNISENISRTYFKETSRSISIFKVTKILLCIMVCVIITYNVILLTYISNEVEYSAGQKVQQHFSELLFSMLKLCLIIQSTDMSYSTNSQYHFKISEISETLVNITDIYENYLLEDYAKWSYCPSSALITENILTIWTQKNSTVSGSLTNLPDVVKSTIFYVKII